MDAQQRDWARARRSTMKRLWPAVLLALVIGVVTWLAVAPGVASYLATAALLGFAGWRTTRWLDGREASHHTEDDPEEFRPPPAMQWPPTT